MKMRTVRFRPLRYVKKLDKIVVCSSRTWSSVMTANNYPFNLIVDNEYIDLAKNEFVYNHVGELLFYYTANPNDIPVYHNSQLSTEEIFRDTKVRGFVSGDYTHYSGIGIDCNGTPTFAHFTADYLATHKYDVTKFEPLTVEVVLNWYGWMLLNMNNANIRAFR